MILNNIKPLFQRDLDRLQSEINGYEQESDLWKVAPGILNSGGNLALHLMGNLRHFLGAVLGKDGYVRNREHEFEAKDISREALIAELKITESVVNHVLTHLPEESLQEIYPIEVFGYPMTTELFLIHLYGHLNYHLGQINYHRRLINNYT